MKFHIALFALFVLTLSHATLGQKDEDLELEFGRKASQRAKGRKLDEMEAVLRELLDHEAVLSMSMSMSMDTMHPPTPPPSMGVSPTPTPNLTSPAPQGPIPDEGFVARGGCDGQVETVVSLGLEVDTAVGKSTFTTEITRALKEALKVDYSFCDSLRRRDLEQASMPIGDVSIVEEAGSCIAQSTTADKCHYAQAVISVFGGEGQDIQSIIKASVETILNDDKAFDDQLLLDGIVDVRLRDETPENRAELTPNVASPPSGSPATAAVVTVAAAGAIVLAALALRRSRRKGGYDNLDEDKAGSVGSTDGGHSHTDTLAATMGGESTTAAAI